VLQQLLTVYYLESQPIQGSLCCQEKQMTLARGVLEMHQSLDQLIFWVELKLP
jgi:hypothetical protein